MAYKILIFIFLLFYQLAYSNILYDKNNISITEIELKNYIKFYYNNYGVAINSNKAIKDVVLIKKTLNNLLINNPAYISELDKIIKSEIGEINFKDKINLNFLRFNKIRNEFISRYFRTEFNIKDLEIIFNSLNEVKFPLSKNNCLTVDFLYDLRSNESFKSKLFDYFKNNQNDLVIDIDNELYNVCLNKNDFVKIENLIINYIEIKIKDQFNTFVYGK